MLQVTDWVDCVGGAQSEWVNTVLNFDNIPAGMLYADGPWAVGRGL